MEGTKPLGFLDRVKAFFSHEPIWYYENCFLELCCCGALLVYSINFFFGKGRNVTVALAARNCTNQTIMRQFEHKGMTNEPNSFALSQESYHQFHYYMSGRKNLLGMEFTYNLKHRHCLLTSVYDLLVGYKDQIIVDIPLDPKDNAGDAQMPIELYCCRLRDYKSAL